ncbi:SNF2-related protein [Kitasatospora sp. MAP12-9]
MLLLQVPLFASADGAVAAAWALVRARPEVATAVLHAHGQTPGSGSLVVGDVEPAESGVFTAQAGWELPEGRVYGAVAGRTTKKAAHQYAAVSLLGHMSGLEPVVQTPAARAWVPAARYSAGTPAQAADQSFATRLQHTLAQPRVAPAEVAEVASRITAGALIPRDLYAVLFTAVSPMWEPARKAALRAAAAEAGAAVTLLTLYQAARGLPAPRFTEHQQEGGSVLFRSRLRAVIDDEALDLYSGWYPNKRQARTALALKVLADLAELPLEAPRGLVPAPAVGGATPQEPGPAEKLQDMVKAGVIHDLVFKEGPGITGLEPQYVCVAACTSNGHVLSGTGRALGRASARAEAAKELVAAIRGRTAVRYGRVPVQAGPGKTALMVLNDLKTAGAIARLDISDPVHDPVAGFTARITCRVRSTLGVLGEEIVGDGAGASKRAAQQTAAAALVEALATAHEPTAPTVATAAPAQAATGPGERLRCGPAGPVALPEEVGQARAELATVLREGAELTVDLQGAAARFLVYRPQGLPVGASCSRPMQVCTATLVLPKQGAAIGPVQVECWQVPVRLLANVLTAEEGREKESPSVTVWRQVIRLGLEVMAQGRVYPTLDADGTDVWRAGPLTAQEKARARQLRQAMVPPAHCGAVADIKPQRLWAPRTAVRAGLDAVAEAMLRGPGTPAVLGSGPFTAAVPQQQHTSALTQWADDAEEGRSQAEVLDMVLTVRAPKKDSPGDTELLWADLSLRRRDPTDGLTRTWSPAAAVADPKLKALLRRRLRRLTQLWPPIGRLLERPVPDTFTLRAAEAVVLRGAAKKQLERLGLTVEWQHEWSERLRTRVVLGQRRPGPPGSARPGFSFDDVLDGRWQLSVDGADLTGREMDALAQSMVPMAKVREQWVLVDEDSAKRAADRQMPPVSSGEALRASLTGQINVDGQLFECEPEEALADLVAFLRSGSRSGQVPAPGGLTTTLRDYQRQGLTWLANTTNAGFGALLADDMGLGKSLTALALHLYRRDLGREAQGPTLIVCPASVMINWEREVNRFAPSVPTLRYHGPDRTLAGATSRTIVITTYETLRRDAPLLAQQPFDLLVADEAQLIKNHRAGTSQAIRRIKTARRIALTGTPVENHLGDAWALMDFLNPGLFGTFRAFREQFAIPIEENITDRTLSSRLTALLQAFMLRRLKSDPQILPELPPKTVSSRIVSLTPEQIDLYEQTAAAALREIRSAEGAPRKGLLLALFNNLQQICNAPSHFLGEATDGDDYDPQQAAARSGKLAALDDLLPLLSSPHESTLVFTRYRTMARHLVHHLRGHGLDPLYFSGDLAVGRERQRIIDAFQASSGKVMVMTVKAGGSGLTLTQASHVVLYDRPWNPAKESQAVDRAHRLGQQRQVTVHHLITENTLEDRVDDLLRHKRALADAVLADGYSALTELTDDQICDLIALGAHR